jgi:GNAT superfamily N-acetyltransferase
MHLKSELCQVYRLVQKEGVGQATLDWFPGDSDIAIVSDVYIPPDERNKGIGTKQHAERLAELDRLGFSYVVCTVGDHNLVEQQILTKHGWEKIKQMRYCSMWMKELQNARPA